MDWSKAKKILIIAFLIMNIILLSTFLYRSKGMKQYITTEADVIEKLKEINVEIHTEIPNDIPDEGLLEVEFEDYRTDSEKIEMARKFLNIGDIIDTNSVETKEDEIIFNNGNEVLKIIKEKELVYINKDRTKVGNSEYDPYAVVNNFVRDKGFSTEDYVLSEMRKNDDSYYLVYSKKYKDTIIEKSYMKFTIYSSRVVNFERLWIEPIKEKKNNIDLRPATDSLLKLLSQKEIYGKNIEDIILCYYFDPTDTKVYDFREPRSGDAIPAWKIEFTDGTIKYLYEN
ncbi:hypothetical protein GOQ27_08515 [Clostridium sp. D2Q-11]|uniref:Regulatory protein YycH-like domain-containing protein n=1 Tax=Anaeromonas frigoriresistens TaxID=2683708 RepID=A0A942Z944_9FIRM|nr:hypothetical protein [Anaeromonas frigoriresistens]MBS4538505.1 hypothetical protein [Anaeromonas frigoriresistens]